MANKISRKSYKYIFIVFCFQEDDVDTALGIVRVNVQGDHSKPAILTYHDIGLNGGLFIRITLLIIVAFFISVYCLLHVLNV